jgi:hypothetical protein
VVKTGYTAAGRGGSVLPFYICEFSAGGRLYRADGRIGGEVVWAIICYSAIFGIEN